VSTFEAILVSMLVSGEFAGPLPRACQIMSDVLLNEFKQHFENRTWAPAAMFEICARTVVSCLRSAHARRLLWEPPDMFIVFCFDARGPFFRSHFRYIFFLKNDDKWTPKWLQKLTQSYQKWHLKIHLSFLMEIHRKATENQKNDVKISSKSMKNWPWSSTKNDA